MNVRPRNRDARRTVIDTITNGLANDDRIFSRMRQLRQSASYNDDDHDLVVLVDGHDWRVRNGRVRF